VSADHVFLIGGLALLVAVVLPTLLERAWLSAPVILIALGALIGLLPLPDAFVMDPVDQRATIVHVTEFTVLLALMGVGLALDRPLSLRRLSGWPTWAATWKLLGIAMPLTIAGVFLLGWWGLGVAAAPALLLGAALAPTDPVLAADVQVGAPGAGQDAVDDEEISERDEVRFALTSEAGLNDGLAFPFVYAAIFVASLGSVTEWGLRWVAWELVGKVVIGVLAGVAVGTAMAWLAFRSERRSLRLSEIGEPLLALAAMLVSYGVAETVGGYGFLAVFTCAMALRAGDRSNRFHEHMHGVIERLERLMTLFILLFVGISVTDGTLVHLDWRGVVIAATLVFGIRPLAGWIALAVGRWRMADEAHRPLERRERAITSFFGIRGVGTLYYLAYALTQTTFDGERWLWATAIFAIILSVVVHGVLATPVMNNLEQRRERLARDPAT
jgi:sodium/hydrogen antiporter